VQQFSPTQLPSFRPTHSPTAVLRTGPQFTVSQLIVGLSFDAWNQYTNKGSTAFIVTVTNPEITASLSPSDVLLTSVSQGWGNADSITMRKTESADKSFSTSLINRDLQSYDGPSGPEGLVFNYTVFIKTPSAAVDILASLTFASLSSELFATTLQKAFEQSLGSNTQLVTGPLRCIYVKASKTEQVTLTTISNNNNEKRETRNVTIPDVPLDQKTPLQVTVTPTYVKAKVQKYFYGKRDY
jgi:hypothetical protein